MRRNACLTLKLVVYAQGRQGRKSSTCLLLIRIAILRVRDLLQVCK